MPSTDRPSEYEKMLQEIAKARADLIDQMERMQMLLTVTDLVLALRMAQRESGRVGLYCAACAQDDHAVCVKGCPCCNEQTDANLR